MNEEQLKSRKIPEGYTEVELPEAFPKWCDPVEVDERFIEGGYYWSGENWRNYQLRDGRVGCFTDNYSSFIAPVDGKVSGPTITHDIFDELKLIAKGKTLQEQGYSPMDDNPSHCYFNGINDERILMARKLLNAFAR